MARYRALVLSFVNSRLVEPGTEVELTGEVGSNFEPIDKEARKAQGEPKLSPDVAVIVSAVRMHAVTRGVSPDEANESDFDEVAKRFDPPLSADAVKAAAKELGVVLGQSVA